MSNFVSFDWLKRLLSDEYHIQKVEVLVIIGIILYVLFILHSLNLFKKD